MRPIDADATKKHVCDMCDDGQRECKGDESCAILCWINDMPTIQPERRSENEGGVSYTYYEIWNRISKSETECTERCVSLETAKEHLEKKHCNWSRPFGTGVIYGVVLVPADNGSINLFRTEVYRKR